MFKFQSFYYDISEKQTFLYDAIINAELQQNNKKIRYYNIPAAFDIETTSFIDSEGKKAACTYIWQFGINGRCIIGRTWQEFIDLLSYISKELELTVKKRLIVYVHNLQYEFQFMRKWLNWVEDEIFAVETRRPVYALTDNGIEFRCSYLLSGLSLEIVGNNLLKYKVQKLTGNLDYNLMRHSKTELTDNEIAYCINDIKVVMAYIQELIENNNGIINIPLTNTGFVRKYCRKECFSSKNYKRFIHELSIENVPEYMQQKRGFQGGFTHANPYFEGVTLSDVASFDFTSSYPYVMLSEKFPIDKGVIVEIDSKEKLFYYLKRYCCLFDIILKNVTPRINYEHYLSFSKCRHVQNYILDNGRIVTADYLETTITEQDFAIIKFCYNFDELQIANFRVYKKGYLPTPFIKSIVKLYADKTKLKGVTGKESEYLLSKGMLNSCFGMCVTDICRDKNSYENDEWLTIKPDYEKMIDDNNNSRNRFLFYAWGIWVTAYARRNLWEGIIEFNDDYVYSDTDSIKALNYQKHMNFINNYNREVEVKLKAACQFHNIPYSEMTPKNIKGEIKLLGIWEFEGIYKHFKTLGAKRYMVETVDKDGKSKFSFTVAGCNKKFAIPYMLEKFGNENMFNAFDNYLEIPADFTGKNTHIYIDEEIKGSLTDYQGKVGSYHELSAINLEKATYSLFIADTYLNYVNGLRTVAY